MEKRLKSCLAQMEELLKHEERLRGMDAAQRQRIIDVC